MASQGVIRRDIYSGFRFFQIIEPQDIVPGGATTGSPVDLRGYVTCTFAVHVGVAAAAMGADYWQFKLEHGESDVDGSVGWSEVYPSQMAHSVVGQAGAYSTLASGIFQSIGSCAGGESFACTIYAVGYLGPRRWARVVLSEVGGASTTSMCVVAILGLPGNWPVADVIL